MTDPVNSAVHTHTHKQIIKKFVDGVLYDNEDCKELVDACVASGYELPDIEKKQLQVQAGRERDFVKGVNSLLPQSIRVFGIVKVIRMFDSRGQCDGRVYEFYLPPSLLSPVNIIKKIFTENASAAAPVGPDCDIDDPKSHWSAASQHEAIVIDNNWMLCDDTMVRFNNILKEFEGTHNFFNFTPKMHKKDPSAVRYITHIHAEVVDVCGDHMVKVVLKGQSFLLNQIRKMICLACEEVRGSCPLGCVRECLITHTPVNVRMVPAQGLVLASLNFEGYNKHKSCPPYTFPLLPTHTHTHTDTETHRDTHTHTLEVFNTSEEFKHTHISPQIASDSHTELWTNWLKDLNSACFYALNQEFCDTLNNNTHTHTETHIDTHMQDAKQELHTHTHTHTHNSKRRH
eukprot:GHVR01147888.1.p1 GENE.GHVR01147888.1~~GHVR01147888.1.p1  ORF type:complete len:401 (+),score=184.21 GHVR01147888.1:186-1388(+)